jgi:glycosyltransferase involved in cell wall biosynthesis
MAERGLPKVSVIIPVFNGTNYLREAINSVLSQSYKNYEIIVVDDGSTDETWAVIQSYSPSLRGIHKENGGVASALNCGIQQAKGTYIAWLSHDDLWLPEKLEKQVAFLEANPQFKACYTDYFVIDAKGNILQEVETPWYPCVQSMRVLFGRMYIGGCTMMVDRACFDRVGLFNENLRTTQDVEMWFRILRCYEIGRLAEKLTQERTFPGQGSRTVVSHETEKVATYTRLFQDMDVAELFPEYTDIASQPRTIAQLYTWFGDTMALYRGWYTFADEQYKQAMYIYPSWRNLARLRWVVGAKRCFFPIRVYRKCRNLIGVAIRAAGLRR